MYKYYKQEKLLISEIKSDKLNYTEAHDMCKELWELVPINIMVNPRRLNKLMFDKYKDSPNYNYSKKYNISI